MPKPVRCKLPTAVLAVPSACLLMAATPASAQTPAPAIPTMKLEARFQGPFPDTMIQRWRDPQTGVLCYLFLPIRVEQIPIPSGGIAYGPNTLGSLSCVSGARDDPSTRQNGNK